MSNTLKHNLIFLLFILIVSSFNSYGQRLNIGAGINTTLFAQHDLILPQQYLYFDPYTFQYGKLNGLNEISVIQITDHQVEKGTNLGFNGYVNYRSKNRFFSNLNVSTSIINEKVFYNRFNTIQSYNLGDSDIEDQYIGYYPEYYYAINSIYFTAQPELGYTIVLNKMIKLDLMAGAFYRYNYFKGYNSQLQKLSLNSEEELRNKEVEQFLFTQSFPGRTSYGFTAGLGLRYFSYSLNLKYNHMIDDLVYNNPNSYLNSLNTLILSFNIDILSFKLIKNQMNEIRR